MRRPARGPLSCLALAALLFPACRSAPPAAPTLAVKIVRMPSRTVRALA